MLVVIIIIVWIIATIILSDIYESKLGLPKEMALYFGLISPIIVYMIYMLAETIIEE